MYHVSMYKLLGKRRYHVTSTKHEIIYVSYDNNIRVI